MYKIMIDFRIADFVRRPSSKNMSDSQARCNFDTTSTHPSFETELIIFSLQNLHAFDIKAELFKVIFTFLKKAAGHNWIFMRRPNVRLVRSIFRVKLVPFELYAPIHQPENVLFDESSKVIFTYLE